MILMSLRIPSRAVRGNGSENVLVRLEVLKHCFSVALREL